MSHRRSLLVGLVALVVAVPISAFAASTTAAVPALAASDPHVQLGERTYLTGTGFVPGASYDLSTEVGVLHLANSTGTTVTADATGSFRPPISITASTAIATATVRASAAGDSTVLASLPITIDPATLRFVNGTACAGHSSTIAGTGFPDGSYLLSSNAGTIGPSESLTAVGGTLSTAWLALADTPPAAVSVTASPVEGADPAVSLSAKLGPAGGSAATPSPRAVVIRASCFDPGETVDVSSPAGVIGPGHVKADAGGAVTVNLQPHPGSNARDLGTATLTGQLSGLVFAQPLGIEPGSTLRAGETMTDLGRLASVWDDYFLSFFAGQLAMVRYGAAGSSADLVGGTSTWVQNTELRLQSDGNLTVYSFDQNRILWSAGTQGTGAHNRLEMQPQGNAFLLNSSNQLLWSSKIGLFRNAEGILSFARVIGSYRKRGTVIFGGEFAHKSSDGNWRSLANGVVYLQRYLNGHWQNVLTRRSGPEGNVQVAFAAPKAFVYRWYLARGSTVASAVSKPKIL